MSLGFQERALLDCVKADLRVLIGGHAARVKAEGMSFASAQSVILGALLNEMAIIIAAAPARAHREQIAVTSERLGAIVREYAVARHSENPEAGA